MAAEHAHIRKHANTHLTTHVTQCARVCGGACHLEACRAAQPLQRALKRVVRAGREQPRRPALVQLQQPPQVAHLPGSRNACTVGCCCAVSRVHVRSTSTAQHSTQHRAPRVPCPCSRLQTTWGSTQTPPAARWAAAAPRPSAWAACARCAPSWASAAPPAPASAPGRRHQAAAAGPPRAPACGCAVCSSGERGGGGGSGCCSGRGQGTRGDANQASPGVHVVPVVEIHVAAAEWPASCWVSQCGARRVAEMLLAAFATGDGLDSDRAEHLFDVSLGV